MKKVSVIVPTYNQRSRMQFVLKTLQNQTYKKEDLEIVVVEDGSTDGTKQFLSTVKMENLSVVSLEHNQGRAIARNQGIIAAKNDILIFIDGDRIVPKDFVYRHVTSLRENCISIGCVAEIFESDVDMLFEHYLRQDQYFFDVIARSRYMNFFEFMSQIYSDSNVTNHPLRWTTLFSGNFCVHKSIFDRVGLFDTDFVDWGLENLELGFRFQCAGFPFFLNKDATNFHLYHCRERNGVERNNNMLTFLKKYNNEGLKFLGDFLDGKMSLEEFQKMMTNEKFDSEFSSFFKKSKYGSKLFASKNCEHIAMMWEMH